MPADAQQDKEACCQEAHISRASTGATLPNPPVVRQAQLC